MGTSPFNAAALWRAIRSIGRVAPCRNRADRDEKSQRHCDSNECADEVRRCGADRCAEADGDQDDDEDRKDGHLSVDLVPSFEEDGDHAQRYELFELASTPRLALRRRATHRR